MCKNLTNINKGEGMECGSRKADCGRVRANFFILLMRGACAGMRSGGVYSPPCNIIKTKR